MDATQHENRHPARTLAERLRNAAREAGAEAAIPRRASMGAPPLSSSQEGLWLLERAFPGTPAYTIATACRLRGRLHAEHLRKAIERVAARHEVLCSAIVERDGLPVQEVVSLDEAPLPFEEIDLCAQDESAREAAALSRVREACLRPFDLTRPPLIRSVLCRVGPDHHVWALLLHHIAGDGASQAILAREISICYRALLEGQPAALPELAIQFADFAAWQRARLAGSAFDEALAWWATHLSGAPPLLELPTDRQRPPTSSHRGAVLVRRLPASHADRLRSIARDAGTTPYVTLLSAFATLLHRWSGETDVVIGAPFSGRDRPELEGVVGYLVDTLPMRIDCSDNPTFLSLVKRVHRTATSVRDHSAVPFTRIVEVLQPTRAANHHPVFQTVLTLREGDASPLDVPDVTVEPLVVDTETAKFDLALEMTDGSPDLEATLEYSTDLFDEETISRLWDRFVQLVDAVAANPQAPIGRLCVTFEDERRAALIDFNPPAPSTATAACLHHLVERQAATTPTSIAVSCGGERLTYHELNARAERIATQLRRLGVGAETCVPFSLQRSVDQVAVMLGILKTGGAYVYLDPAYPSDRLRFLQEDCKAPLTVTETAFIERIPWRRAVLLEEDGHLSPPLRNDSGPLTPLHANAEIGASGDARTPPSANTLAYVTYTSGSTGRPKGVATPHRAVVSFLEAARAEKWLASSDVSAAVSALSFDFHIIETWLPLVSGAEVALVPREVAADGRALRKIVEDRSVTFMGATPATFRLLLEAGWTPASGFKIHCGGEVVPPDLIDRLIASGAHVWTVYGPTETTVYATSHLVTRGESPLPIGRPLQNTRTYIVDAYGQLVASGARGELLIGGGGVARGYLERPELTAEKFVDNPFAAQERAFGLTPPPRLYRSGDVVRRRRDGVLEFVGRIDQQVKIRGFRIELGEIEAVLCGYAAVRQAVVTVRQGTSGEPHLVGYIVHDGEVDLDDVRAHVARMLPPHMCPSALVPLEALPLTTTGKIDRRALPTPDLSAYESGVDYAPPRTPTEKRLTALWAEVLGVPRVGIHDSFFRLGGHSMLAARLFARVSRELGRDLPLALLFEAPTPGEMAARLDADEAPVRRSTLVPIQREGHRPPFFWLHTLGGGGGGGLLRYQGLARRLGADQPSYGLEAPHAPFETLEAMATAYIEVIREVQPRGPYYLGGFCFGGVVAYEMACQLRQRGEIVGLVALLDARVPALETPPSMATRLRRFLSRSPRGQLATLARHARRLRDRIGGRGRAASAGATVPLEEVVDVSRYPEGFVHYARVHWAALLAYRPRPQTGRVDLFAVADSESDAQAEWRALCADSLTTHHLAGTHDTLLEEPWVDGLAQVLAPLLEQRQRELQTQGEESNP